VPFPSEPSNGTDESEGEGTSSPLSPHRPIRSFVLRQGRMTPAQQRAFDAHWAYYGLEFSGKPRNLAATFGRAAPIVLEIGFGNGEQLHAAARDDPARDYLGIEVHGPGVGRLLNAAAADGLQNLRVLRHDAVEVLRDEVAEGALEQVRVWFPDPWHKTRHHKRRLIQPPFVDLVASRLARGGVLHLATDWQDYATHMLAVLEACPALRNTAGPGQYAPCPPWRSETRFERRGRTLGHGVWDLVHVRE
jgi:tRNA (guanine-N7-)-methyltransferase